MGTGTDTYLVTIEDSNAREVPVGNKLTKDQVLEALKDVYDPEIPVNIVDLGLVYRVDVNDENEVEVDMTLTAPGCGMGPYIGQQAEWRIAELDEVEDVKVNVVFEPPWTPDRISEDGKKLLGID